ncbi:MAG: dihydroorotase family protein [Chloroflexales bacterium]|nr:dihydroorotase family protein [Chloroflexales bacterium]
MSLDLAIVNGTIVDEHGARSADLGIHHGKLSVLAPPHTLPAAAETLDARGLWVLPGIVDAHFHCRAPDSPEREDFMSGTAAAAAGGVTTLFEMPLAHRSVSSAEVLRERQALIERDAYIDVSLFAAGGTLDPSATAALADAGAIGYKIFTHRAPPGRIAQFSDLSIFNKQDLYTALSLIQKTGLPCAIHAEDDQLLELFAQQVERSTLTGVDAYLATRPPAVEAMAVAELAILAEATGAHVHIVHVTSAWAVDIIRTARKRGAPITAETCPQYLLFDEDTARRYGPWTKIAPPLRTTSDREALWAALGDGTLDLIASDHAPFTPADKQNVDLLAAPSGMPNVEVAAPLMLSAALEGKLPIERMIALLTANPARVYGVYPQKGALAVGSDADVIIYDPHATSTIDIQSWFSRSKGSARAFDGLSYRGRVLQTIVRGKTVYRHGQIVGARGAGELVRPQNRA